MGQVLRKVEEYKDESQIYINAIHGKSKGWITKSITRHRFYTRKYIHIIKYIL